MTFQSKKRPIGVAFGLSNGDPGLQDDGHCLRLVTFSVRCAVIARSLNISHFTRYKQTREERTTRTTRTRAHAATNRSELVCSGEWSRIEPASFADIVRTIPSRRKSPYPRSIVSFLITTHDACGYIILLSAYLRSAVLRNIIQI